MEKMYHPWELIHSELYETRGDAIKRERFLKNIGSVKNRISEITSGKL